MNAAKNSTHTQFCENHSMIYPYTVKRLMDKISAHRLGLSLFFYAKIVRSVRWHTFVEVFLLHLHNQPPSNPARFNPFFMYGQLRMSCHNMPVR